MGACLSASSYDRVGTRKEEWVVDPIAALALVIFWLVTLVVAVFAGSIHYRQDVIAAVSEEWPPLYGEWPLPSSAPVSIPVTRQLDISACTHRSVLEATERIVFRSTVSGHGSTSMTAIHTTIADSCRHGVIIYSLDPDLTLYLLRQQAFLTSRNNAVSVMAQLVNGSGENQTIEEMAGARHVFYPRTILHGRIASNVVEDTGTTLSMFSTHKSRNLQSECEGLAGTQPVCYPMYFSCMEEWDVYYETLNGCKAAMHKERLNAGGGDMMF